MKNQKIAIVYDWIDKWGGVERLLLTLHELLPTADFFTSYYDKDKAVWAKDLSIKTSFIQQLPSLIKQSRILSLPFYPYAFESLNLSHYDVVISVTSSFAKGIITRPETKHICYLLTPTRYFWVYPEYYLSNSIMKLSGSQYLSKLREWDYIAAQRSDKIISISQLVADRCEKYYQRKSTVIYPPFDTHYWNNIDLRVKNEKLKIKNYFLVVSRLEPYKKVDVVINAFNQLPDKNLIIVGVGSQKSHLKKLAKDTIQFIENINDEELAQLYSHAEALIMPQEEDFGYVSLEAQYFGCPVITYKKSGAVETIIEGKTGITFPEQTVESLLNTLETFHTLSYNLKLVAKKEGPIQCLRFSKDQFAKHFSTIISTQ